MDQQTYNPDPQIATDMLDIYNNLSPETKANIDALAKDLLKRLKDRGARKIGIIGARELVMVRTAVLAKHTGWITCREALEKETK